MKSIKDRQIILITLSTLFILLILVYVNVSTESLNRESDITSYVYQTRESYSSSEMSNEDVHELLPKEIYQVMDQMSDSEQSVTTKNSFTASNEDEYVVNFITSTDPDMVSTEYESTLQKGGWDVLVETLEQNSNYVITAKQQNNASKLRITIHRNGEKTGVETNISAQN